MSAGTTLPYARLRIVLTVAAIAAAYVQAEITREGPWLTWRYAAFVALGLGYLLAGVLWQPRCEAAGSPRQTAFYFAVQLPLATVLVYLSPACGPEFYLLLPLLAQAIFMLPARLAIPLWLLLFGVEISSYGASWAWDALIRHAWGMMMGLVFVVGFSLFILREAAARRRAEELAGSLESANARLRESAAQAEELAVARERNRLAREIHDGLGHYLTAIAIQTEAAEALIPRDPARATASVANARTLAQEALADVRRSVQALRTDAERPPLLRQLEQLAALATDLTVVIEARGPSRRLPTAVEHALVRTVQEGLTNVRKHAGVKPARITLDFTDPARVALELGDDGRGPAGPAREGCGLNGIRERVELLGGRMRAGAGAHGGFILHVEVPA